MSNLGGRLIGAALFGAAAICVSNVQAETSCPRIEFAAGSTSTLVRGVAPAGGSHVCYILAARKGQFVTLKVIDGVDRVVFKIDDPIFYSSDDALHISTFQTKRKAYRFIVFDEERGTSAIPFTLSISLK